MITRIFIDEQAKTLPSAAPWLNGFHGLIQTVRDAAEVYHIVSRADDPILFGKQCLLLTVNRGEFIRKCPGTAYYTCCGYMILHIGTYCYMDCAYCILQTYFHPPLLKLFINQDSLHRELEHFLAYGRDRRIGTGEFTDSLIWERWLDISTPLILKFAAQSRAVLELKTKTVLIERLKNIDHQRKTIIAWSLNTDTVIRHEERCTASLSARLQAARQCQHWGYPLAFHFDPLVVYEGCEAEYEQVIERLFAAVSPENIVWISLGAYRFPPAMKPIIKQRFPDSVLAFGEFIAGPDGKMRYFKPIRLRLFQRLIRKIREFAPDLTLYFCMEDKDIWQACMGFDPGQQGLSDMLDQSAARVCGLT